MHVINSGFRPSVLGDHARRSPVLPDSSTSPQSPSPYHPTYPDHTQPDTLSTPHAPMGVLVHGSPPGVVGADVDRDPVSSPPRIPPRGHAARRAAPARRPCPPTALRPSRGRAPLRRILASPLTAVSEASAHPSRRPLARATTPFRLPLPRWWYRCVAVPCLRLPRAGHPTPEMPESTRPVAR